MASQTTEFLSTPGCYKTHTLFPSKNPLKEDIGRSAPWVVLPPQSTKNSPAVLGQQEDKWLHKVKGQEQSKTLGLVGFSVAPVGQAKDNISPAVGAAGMPDSDDKVTLKRCSLFWGEPGKRTFWWKGLFTWEGRAGAG